MTVRGLIQWVHSWTCWTLCAVLILVFTLVGVAPLPWVTDVPAYTHRWIRFYFRCVLGLCRLSPRVHGLDSLGVLLARGPVVFAVNHQSILDIVVLGACLPADLAFVAKGVLFRIPVLGFVMRLARMVRLEARGGRGAERALEPAAAALAEGRCVVMFPEGTRSKDGTLGTFHRGAAVLSRMAGVPLVPVALVGIHEILPPDALTGRPGPIDAVLCDPVEPGSDETSEDQIQTARDRIQGAQRWITEQRESRVAPSR